MNAPLNLNSKNTSPAMEKRTAAFKYHSLFPFSSLINAGNKKRKGVIFKAIKSGLAGKYILNTKPRLKTRYKAVVAAVNGIKD